MCRTTLNVTGDLAAAVYVSRGEPAPTAEPDRARLETDSPAS
jgi:DAACS family dicarboxylate/amino acid:cation (Na+ or H+) symporter